jgi:hypothetical protein
VRNNPLRYTDPSGHGSPLPQREIDVSGWNKWVVGALRVALFVLGGQTSVEEDTLKIEPSLTIPFGADLIIEAPAAATASRLGDMVDDAAAQLTDDAAVAAGETVKPDFYVRPNGEVIPATGYRYSKGEQFVTAVERGLLPSKAEGTYFSFDRYDTGLLAKDRLQLPYSPELRVSFDTLPIIDDIHIPYGRWGEADYLEPIVRDFPQGGTGGGTQAVTYSPIPVSIRNLWRLE